ncbi:MAG: acetyl-CoA decarbonylase/synthase complex subunit gamma [Candidatus Omnitrophica bacterium]|nr:acetyl-CoA decarbonylase/synthase complex subunit gamma [Candidatus Omnitrophota bacterium]MBU1932788.1 acetyl-CoA decarbonylase/synthase complex subunit gamma [Candidatus Omnitrophota bacterium]
MALSGLEIYKLLPKTNCKKCGSPTCLAFAMKLAMKKASLDDCPDVTEEAKKALDQASRPPIATIVIGAGDNRIEIGGETVLFRHEKTFYHQTAIAISVDDTLSVSEIDRRVKNIEEMSFERVGQHITIDMIALVNKTGSSEKFTAALERVLQNSTKAMVLVSDDVKVIEEALKKCAEEKPLIYAATGSNLKDMCRLSKDYKVPLAIKAKGPDELGKLSQEAASLGAEELVLDPLPETLNQALNDFTQIRRASLKKNYRPFGYPIVSFIKAEDEDKYGSVRDASVYITKYAGLIVLDSLDREVLLPIVTLRQNIYTDPQKPVTVEPKLYSFGAVDKNSPVMVTTNFSLTFYTVSPEIEASKLPAYLLVTDSEGMSVLTAWAAEKFTPEIIADTMKKLELENVVSHKKIIIPGYVSVLSGKLEDASGWNVMVGPKEASAIPKYLKEVWK